MGSNPTASSHEKSNLSWRPPVERACTAAFELRAGPEATGRFLKEQLRNIALLDRFSVDVIVRNRRIDWRTYKDGDCISGIIVDNQDD